MLDNDDNTENNRLDELCFSIGQSLKYDLNTDELLDDNFIFKSYEDFLEARKFCNENDFDLTPLTSISDIPEELFMELKLKFL